MNSYGYLTSMKNVFNNYLDRVQVSIPGLGFLPNHGEALRVDLRWSPRKTFPSYLYRFQYPRSFSAWTTDVPVGMNGSARRFIGRRFYVQCISEIQTAHIAKEGIAEFLNGDMILFHTTDSSILSNRRYRIQRARFDSLPRSQPLLRIISAEEVVE